MMSVRFRSGANLDTPSECLFFSYGIERPYYVQKAEVSKIHSFQADDPEPKYLEGSEKKKYVGP
jgi:hypothetical protein